MKNIFKVIGIVALVAVIGFSIAACGGDDDGGGGGGGGESIKWNNYSNGAFVVMTFNNVTDTYTNSDGFTITADGIPQTKDTSIKVFDYSNNSCMIKLGFSYGTTLPTSTVVKVSYNGTGAYTGIAAFTDKTATYDSSLIFY